MEFINLFKNLWILHSVTLSVSQQRGSFSINWQGPINVPNAQTTLLSQVGEVPFLFHVLPPFICRV